MSRIIVRMALAFIAVCLLSTAARADSYAVGFISLDTPNTATSGQFDITNLTGSSFLPPDAPVSTPLTFTLTSLTVDTSGGTVVLTGSDFTTDSSGDLIGSTTFNLLTTTILNASLMGTLSPTTGIDVSGAGTVTIQGDMTDGLGGTTISLTDPSGSLAPGDLAVIYATTGAVSVVPEPSILLLLGSGLVGLAATRQRRRLSA